MMKKMKEVNGRLNVSDRTFLDNLVNLFNCFKMKINLVT